MKIKNFKNFFKFSIDKLAVYDIYVLKGYKTGSERARWVCAMLKNNNKKERGFL